MAPSTYYAANNRQPCAREQRDAAMVPVLVKIWEDHYRVYGACKLWKAAVRAVHDIDRDQTARPMGTAGIEGARRGKRVRTTRPDLAGARHPDLVGRDFTAGAPNQLWIADLIANVVKQLRPLRSATIAINGTTETFPSQIPPAQQKILDSLGIPEPGH